MQPPRPQRQSLIRHERRRLPRAPAAGAGVRLASSMALHGERVLDRDGKPLGTVCELMLDLKRGRIAYAVVAFGGFMGLGERLHALPWRALHADVERRALVLDADRETFLAAPVFNRDDWPSAPQAQWHHELHRHYGCPPYWE